MGFNGSIAISPLATEEVDGYVWPKGSVSMAQSPSVLLQLPAECGDSDGGYRFQWLNRHQSSCNPQNSPGKRKLGKFQWLNRHQSSCNLAYIRTGMRNLVSFNGSIAISPLATLTAVRLPLTGAGFNGSIAISPLATAPLGVPLPR